jgi:hypothetical protein
MNSTIEIQTEAAREYQLVSSRTTIGMRAANSAQDRTFWSNWHYSKSLEIANKHGLTIRELMDTWEAYSESRKGK